MSTLISPPKSIPLWLRIGLSITKRVTGKDLLPPRLLAWYPKAAFSSGIMEALVAHQDGELSARMLKLVRMQASFSTACPFCIDMNSHKFSQFHITQEELGAIQGLTPVGSVETFSEREKIALDYARTISSTPLKFSPDLMQ